VRLTWLKRLGKEHGQAIPLIALAMFALIAMVGFAIDVGRIYAKRTQLTRSLDAGALAGVQELPDMTKARTIAQAYVAYNQPDATNITANQVGALQQIRVSASITVPMTFLKIVGVPPATVTQSAVAGMGDVPMDVVMALDVTGSMGYSPCNAGYSNSGCKIKEMRDAANLLVDTLLGTSPSGSTLIGMDAFNWCWKPPSTNSACRQTSSVVPLTSNKTTLHNAVNALLPNSYTSVCEGLYEANSILFGAGARPNPPAFKAIVLMTDGANTYADSGTHSSCRPGTLISSCCNECPGNSMTGGIDTKTYQLAQTLKAANVEVFVVALDPCDTLNTSLCDVTKIGQYTGNYPTNLLKCVASSLPGGNDHYFETNDPTQLSNIFLSIARLLALRLLE
jgi:hypothetical protein